MSLQQQEIGPEARPPRRPRNRVGQGARKVPRQFPLIFRISNRSHFSVAPCRTRASRSLAMKAAKGIVTLAREAESESVQRRAWRGSLGEEMGGPKFLEHS